MKNLVLSSAPKLWLCPTSAFDFVWLSIASSISSTRLGLSLVLFLSLAMLTQWLQQLLQLLVSFISKFPSPLSVQFEIMHVRKDPRICALSPYWRTHANVKASQHWGFLYHAPHNLRVPCISKGSFPC